MPVPAAAALPAELWFSVSCHRPEQKCQMGMTTNGRGGCTACTDPAPTSAWGGAGTCDAYATEPSDAKGTCACADCKAGFDVEADGSCTVRGHFSRPTGWCLPAPSCLLRSGCHRPASGVLLRILRLPAPPRLLQCTKVAENCVKLSPDSCTCKYCNSGFSLSTGGITCDAWCARQHRGRAGVARKGAAHASSPACRPRLPLGCMVCCSHIHCSPLPASCLAALLLARPQPSAPFLPPTPAPGELRYAGSTPSPLCVECGALLRSCLHCRSHCCSHCFPRCRVQPHLPPRLEPREWGLCAGEVRACVPVAPCCNGAQMSDTLTESMECRSALVTRRPRSAAAMSATRAAARAACPDTAL